jgi:hypothetical protein
MIVKLPAGGSSFIYVNREHVIYMDATGDGTRLWVTNIAAGAPGAFFQSLLTSLSLDDAMAALNAPSVSVSLSSIPELSIDTTTTGTIS